MTPLVCAFTDSKREIQFKRAVEDGDLFAQARLLQDELSERLRLLAVKDVDQKIRLGEL